MKYIIKSFIVITILVIHGCSPKKIGSDYDKLAFEVKDTTRLFAFTNKKFGFYYGRTNGYFNDGWMGWTVREQRIFNDYALFVDGKKLERNRSTSFIYPHMFKRLYENGIEESFCLTDSADMILISFKNLNRKKIQFKIDGLVEGEQHFSGNENKIDIGKALPGFSLYIASDATIIKAKNNLLEYDDIDSVKIILAVTNSDINTKDVIKHFQSYLQKKKQRIEKLLSGSYVKTDNEEFDKALAWAKVSLDALITEQDYTGIWAGLPWFNNNWGRDTFISLPGATLVTGNYGDAKNILLGFAKFQDTNPTSKYYGRIPNRITLKEKIYNTADGTPWFVIQVYNYFKYTNDVEFIKSIYPVIKLALNTAIKKRIDQNGFLIHADAETWMDAVGPNGPWSPRGNRAVDIQALWFKQLTVTSEIAQLMNDNEFSETAQLHAEKVKSNFERFYLNNSKDFIFDRLKPDGTKDSTLRPNLFFALNEPNLFSSSLTRLKVLGNVFDKLVFTYGVLSLSQLDSNFHPYHNYPPYYVKDAAYHNGIIWQWNSGPVISSICGFGKQDLAWSLTAELTNQILNRGAVGTLAELMDAFPKQEKDEPYLSGTFSQAWSLAEYVRNFYQDYLGVSVDASKKTIYLLPTLPSVLKNVEFDQKIGNDIVRVKYLFGDDYYRVQINGNGISDSIDVAIGILNIADANYQMKTAIYKKDELTIEIPSHSNSLRDLKAFRNDRRISISCQMYNEPPANEALYSKIKFAQPKLNKYLKSLRGPGYQLLSNSEVKKENNNAKLILNINDKLNDENYLYPANPNFSDGILDLKNFSLREDESNYYFKLEYRNLSNPGWHNEYGYQLTFANICIQTDIKSATITRLEQNSNYSLPSERKANYIIRIGGGIELLNSSRKIIFAYVPQPEDMKNPLGSIAAKVISFSIPKKYISGIDGNSKITILVGAQDDHGGAGIGEFREVTSKPGEWTGGGKKNEGESNVYDILLIN